MDFMFFDCDNGAVLVKRRDQIQSIIQDGFIGSAEIVDQDGITLSRYRDAAINADNDAEMRQLLLNLIASIPVGDVSNVETLYTGGRCDVLAVALSKVVPEGEVVGIFDPFNEDGNEIVGQHYLVHAGLRVGDMVTDVTGSYEQEDWMLQWCHLGSLDVYIDVVTETRLDEIRHRPASEMETHSASEIAELLAFAIEATKPQSHLALQT